MEYLRLFTDLVDVETEYDKELYEVFLLEGEQVEFAFKSESKGAKAVTGDRVIFTDKRIITIESPGKGRDIFCIPFSKIVAHSFTLRSESYIGEVPFLGASLDLYSRVTVWLSGVGKVEFQFSFSASLASSMKLGKLLSQHI